MAKSNFADQELSFKALERLLRTLSQAKAGDFSVRMAADGDGMEREVADSLNEVLTLLDDFTREFERVSDSVTQGELRVRLPLDKANGAWGQQLRAVNNIVVVFGKHVAELRRVVKSIHNGDMSRPVNVAPDAVHRGGELARVAEDVNTMIAHVDKVTAEITRVFAEVGLDGRLNSQCHISDASGSWGLLVGSVNAASASLSEQVQDLCSTAQALAAGNLSARATVTSRGDLQTLKLGLNSAAEGLAALCSELRRIAHEVAIEGKLAVELRHPDARGEWQSAQDAVNRMLAAFATSWRSVAAQAERVFEGDYAEPEHNLAPGELGEPAAAMQRLAEQQANTQAALQALIDGRFGDVRLANDSERDVALMQLGMRLKREWFRSTRAGLYEVREQHSTPQGWVEAALSTVVQTAGAVAGAYYLLNEEQRLVRLANLGCEQPANEVPIGLGEGLLGKVALEGRAQLLDKLDQHSSRVRTGLLEIVPRAALIYPVKREASVCAVLELLFVNDGAATALELLDYLSIDLAKGPIAAEGGRTIDATRVRALEEELVIANARIEGMTAEIQHHRDRGPRSAAQ